MSVFWLIVGLMLACALAFVLVPLMRKRRADAAVTRDAINISVYRDQLRELDADLEAGTLTPGRHEEAVREIERRVLEDTRGSPEGTRPHAGGRGMAIAVGIALPVLAASLYLLVGTPQALAPGGAAPGAGPGIDVQQFEAMVGQLAARLEKAPENPQGWVMLARSYVVLAKFPEAAKAYANAVARNPGEPQLLADYANALAMAQGGRLEGEPEKLIAKALAVDPDNIKALALAGTAAFDRRDYKAALAHWERIVRLAPPESEFGQSVRASIEEARVLAGGTGKTAVASPAPALKSSPAAAAASISGVVHLAPELAGKVAPTDTLFVFARAAEGSRMPVAVLRARAGDLPLQFTLDDGSSMMPAAKLSDQRLVVVGARISRSGSAIAQPGDVQGYSAPVAPGASGLRIVVSEVAK